MNVLDFSLALFVTSILAGFLGAMTGLGGGVVIIPALCLLFKVDVHYALGASLISVIATSSGAAAAYVREGFSNIRIGMFLEVATTLGALLGAYLTAKVSGNWIGVIFGLVLLYSAWMSVQKLADVPKIGKPDPLALRLNLRGSYPVSGGSQEYVAEHVPAAFGIMFGAGALSVLVFPALARTFSRPAPAPGSRPGRRSCPSSGKGRSSARRCWTDGTTLVPTAVVATLART